MPPMTNSRPPWGRLINNAAQAKLDKEMDARFDRLVDHVNREVGVAQDTPLADRVQSLDDWSHRFVNIFLKLEQRIERPWFRKGQALLKELSPS
jgi:hypothetical protein